jgi:hypothetical protein
LKERKMKNKIKEKKNEEMAGFCEHGDEPSGSDAT